MNMNMGNKQPDKAALLAGLFFIVAYCGVTASSAVIVNQLEQVFDELALLLFSFTFAMLFFNCVNVGKLGGMYRLVSQNRGDVVAINVTTAFVWLITFYGLKHLSPAIFIALYMGARPLSTFILTLKKNIGSPQLKRDFIFALIIAVWFILLISDEIYNIDDWVNAGIFMLMAIFAGTMGSLNNIYAHQLSLDGMSATQVLAVRFNLLILTVLVTLFFHPEHLGQITDHTIEGALLIAVITVALPVYCLQRSLQYIGPMRVSFLVPLIPVFTYFLQLFGHYPFHLVEFILVVGLSFTIICSQVTLAGVRSLVLTVKQRLP